MHGAGGGRSNYKETPLTPALCQLVSPRRSRIGPGIDEQPSLDFAFHDREPHWHGPLYTADFHAVMIADFRVCIKDYSHETGGHAAFAARTKQQILLGWAGVIASKRTGLPNQNRRGSDLPH